MIGHHSSYSFSRKWRFTSMARFSRKEKAAFFNARAIMTRKIMRSRDAQCNTGEFAIIIMHLAGSPGSYFAFLKDCLEEWSKKKKN